MDEEENEMFAFLTFFKICKMYQALRKSRRDIGSRSLPERQHNVPTAARVIQRPQTSRNFSMFSQTPQQQAHKRHIVRSACVNDSVERKHNLQGEIQNTATVKLPQEAPSKLSGTVQPKSEICFSDWQVSDQTASNHSLSQQSTEGEEHTMDSVDDNQDIIDTIFDQINDSDLKHDEVGTQQNSTEGNVDFQISFVFNDEDIPQPSETLTLVEEINTTPVVVKKKRRRRRRPGDPPLPPLPKIKKKHVRRYKVRPENRNRYQESYFQTVFKKVKQNDEEHFLQLVRITPKSFDTILKGVRFPMRQHKQTVRAEERLAITLL